MNVTVNSWAMFWAAGFVFGLGAIMCICAFVTIINLIEWIEGLNKLIKKQKKKKSNGGI